ncbi:MAG: aspartate/glutamate racemase family protein [Spirochaetales bacterium]|nr:aspartate/glutamate racemase family protein [Spirochaetales bacterium]
MNVGKSRAKVGFLHTTPATINMVEAGMRAHVPDTECVHIYDSRIRAENFRSPPGEMPRINMVRYLHYAQELEHDGCMVIVSCCSLMGRATAFARQAVSVPFIQLDDIVLEKAVREHARIGIICTTEHTVPCVREQLEQKAHMLGKQVELIFSVNTEAFKYFYEGKIEAHDSLLVAEMRKMEMRDVDCIVLGQIPLALAEPAFRADTWRVPLYYAGAEAFQHIAELMEGQK